MEVYKRVYIKTADDLPKDIILHVGNKKGFEELIYIEDGKTKKPWRYDDNDIATLSINSIDWYMEPVEMPTDKTMLTKCDSNIQNLKLPEDQKSAYTNGFCNCFDWLLSKLK